MKSRPDEYLIQTTIKGVSRKLVWQSDELLDIDMPNSWTVAKHNGQIYLKDTSDPDVENIMTIPEPVEGARNVIELPPALSSRGRRPLKVEITKLKAPRPVYVTHTSQHALHTMEPRQLCAFYGQRYFLIRYRPISKSHVVNLGSIKIFSYNKSTTGYSIEALQAGLKISIGSRKISLPPGQLLELPDVDFLRSTMILGVHWWRFRMVPTPDQQPPLETDETEEDLRERVRLKYSTISFLSGVMLLTILSFVITKLYPPPLKKVVVEVTMRAPKLIPPPVEAPKKVEPPPAPPKIAEVPPPPPPKAKEPPKPKPQKRVAKEKPKAAPRPVAKAPPPAAKPAPVEAPKAPPPKVVKQGPSPEQLAATQKAQVQAAQQAQLLKSLNFLSTAKSRPTVDAANYASKTGKFSDTPMVGGVTSKSNVLDKIAKGAPGDGSIKTGSGRGIASKIDFGNNKGLNDVQGRVSQNELYSKDGNPGNSLGGGKSLEMSGPGNLSESQIEKALAKYLARFQYCYEKSLLTDSSLSGNLVIQWSITTAGKVTDSRVVKSQLNNNDLHNCVLKILAEVPFPKPKGGDVTVKKTFSFSSSSL